MKLYHGETLIGTIRRAAPSGMELGGQIELTPIAEKYSELFAFIVDKKRERSMEPPFPEEMLENWFVENDEGVREEIGLPGIYKEADRTEIYWRYY
jgi:hypothetical protein